MLELLNAEKNLLNDVEYGAMEEIFWLSILLKNGKD
jgi:hypothetical protein